MYYMFKNHIAMKSWFKVFVLALALVGLLVGGRQSAHAALGLEREAYGVWDREGGHSVKGLLPKATAGDGD